jgi:2-polyprenyl-3-methyl-5-hydroxy-6-metoxy-1,4-benzoquinol methylase
MFKNYISKRENHIKNHQEFNIEEEYKFNLNDLVNWVEIISKKYEINGKNVKILELGTKRSINSRPTHRRDYFKNIKNIEYIMTDYQEGLDVDVVCDLHKTEDVFENESFDLIISFSTFEHLKYPQLCAHNLMKLLKIGGRILIETHQTFPLHGYKHDYFRFSREAIKSIFSKKMNFKTITSYFVGDCVIIPHEQPSCWNDVAESYLNIFYIGEKIDKTPQEYIYDIDGDN